MADVTTPGIVYKGSEVSVDYFGHPVETLALILLLALILGGATAIFILWRTLTRERKAKIERRCNGNTEHITRKDFEEYKDHVDEVIGKFKDENAEDHKRMRDNFDRVFKSLEAIGRDVGRLLGRTERD